jgi:hypothetical protein
MDTYEIRDVAALVGLGKLGDYFVLPATPHVHLTRRWAEFERLYRSAPVLVQIWIKTWVEEAWYHKPAPDRLQHLHFPCLRAHLLGLQLSQMILHTLYEIDQEMAARGFNERDQNQRNDMRRRRHAMEVQTRHFLGLVMAESWAPCSCSRLFNEAHQLELQMTSNP